MSARETSPTTLRTIRDWVKANQRFAMLTCYDATTASWLWRAGVKCLLVGDTAAQMILGHDSTLRAPLPFMLEITAGVKRGAPGAFVMGDMPFGSYQCGDDEAVRNAIRFLTDGAADAVKLEVGDASVPLVKRLTDAGVPVVAHIGAKPQHVRVHGGYGPVGRTQDEADALVETARSMVEHGAVMVLVEAVPAEVSQEIVEILTKTAADNDQPMVPVIGCGAGPACHGHVVVLHDLLGLSPWQPPFARAQVDMSQQLITAAGRWVEMVESGRYLREDHPYQMTS